MQASLQTVTSGLDLVEIEQPNCQSITIYIDFDWERLNHYSMSGLDLVKLEQPNCHSITMYIDFDWVLIFG